MGTDSNHSGFSNDSNFKRIRRETLLSQTAEEDQ
jgi:hypothetical protein